MVFLEYQVLHNIILLSAECGVLQAGGGGEGQGGGGGVGGRGLDGVSLEGVHQGCGVVELPDVRRVGVWGGTQQGVEEGVRGIVCTLQEEVQYSTGRGGQWTGAGVGTNGRGKIHYIVIIIYIL